MHSYRSSTFRMNTPLLCSWSKNKPSKQPSRSRRQSRLNAKREMRNKFRNVVLNKNWRIDDVQDDKK
jgi:hypothetical protein